MQQSITAVLSLTDIFDNLSTTELELVASICNSDTYEKGKILVKENESSTDLYIIARGGVEIIMNPSFVGADPEAHDPVVLTELRQGQVFGEVALVDQGIRSATVRVSQENSLLLVIERDQLMNLCDTYADLGYKLMKNVAADLAFKIRNTDLTVRQYQLLLSQSKHSNA